jgi:nitrogen PTS system EIIA component
MTLIDFFREECILLKSQAGSKKELLEEIANLAKKTSALDEVSREEILKGLEDREALGSTGFQDGIAIPHCLLSGVKEFVVGLVTHGQGVDFASLDGKPTRIIAFIIGPRQERNDHIRILSTLSRVLSDQTAATELLSTETPTAAMESLLRTLGDTLTQNKSSRRNIITVTVQNEQLFPDILQLFSEEDECFISVIDAHDGSEYLDAMPLFAAFWNDDKKGFHRIIVASIKHSLANEMLRRLDTLVGGLKECKGLFVQIQDVLYAAGRIEL